MFSVLFICTFNIYCIDLITPFIFLFPPSVSLPSDALRRYHSINNTFPDRIIVFRDGVGDGQVSIVPVPAAQSHTHAYIHWTCLHTQHVLLDVFVTSIVVLFTCFVSPSQLHVVKEHEVAQMLSAFEGFK